MGPYGSHHHPVKQWMCQWSRWGSISDAEAERGALRGVCPVQKKMLEWLLAPDGVWLQGSLGSRARQEYFPAEHVSLSSGEDLYCFSFTRVYWCEMSVVRVFFFLFSCLLIEQRSRCRPRVWHFLSLFESSVCVCARWYSFPISLPLSH